MRSTTAITVLRRRIAVVVGAVLVAAAAVAVGVGTGAPPAEAGYVLSFDGPAGHCERYVDAHDYPQGSLYHAQALVKIKEYTDHPTSTHVYCGSTLTVLTYVDSPFGLLEQRRTCNHSTYTGTWVYCGTSRSYVNDCVKAKAGGPLTTGVTRSGGEAPS